MKADQNHLIVQNNKLVDFLIHLCDQAYGPRVENVEIKKVVPVVPEKKSHHKTGGAGKGNYPRKKKYACVACSNEFKSAEELIDVTCPSCGSTEIVTR